MLATALDRDIKPLEDLCSYTRNTRKTNTATHPSVSSRARAVSNQQNPPTIHPPPIHRTICLERSFTLLSALSTLLHTARKSGTWHTGLQRPPASAPCHPPFPDRETPLPPSTPCLVRPTSERLRGLLRRGEKGVVPVPVLGRRHDLAVRSHSWSSRHAHPVAQWCARLHFHLCCVRERMCRVSAVCRAVYVCGPCV